MNLKQSYSNYVILLSLIFLFFAESSFSMQHNLNSNADTIMSDSEQELWGRCDEKDCSGYCPRKSCKDMNRLKLNIHKHYRLKHAKKIRLFHEKFKKNPDKFIASSALIKIYNKKNRSLIKGSRQSYLFQNIVKHFQDFHPPKPEQQIEFSLLRTTENIRNSLRTLNGKLYIAYNIKICDKKAELEAICLNVIKDENGEEKACTYKSYGKVRFKCEVGYLLRAHHNNLKCHISLKKDEIEKEINNLEFPENLNILDLDLTQDLVDPY